VPERASASTPSSSSDQEIFLLDPLERLDLAPVMELIEDEDIQVVVHAGRQDLELFYERHRTVPRNVFDVQIAAGFGGHGASLSYGRLVESVLGTSLKKGESYTDWCRRPLTREQLLYAADDVRYLLPAADRLRSDLDAKGRLGWTIEEMASLSEEETYAIDPDEMWRKVGGRGTLSGRQLAVLRELAARREETAVQRDIPRGWVIKDPTLIEIARRAPSTIGALKDIRGLNAKEAERSERGGGDRHRTRRHQERSRSAPRRSVLGDPR
jgi:ribonuclease D